MFSLVVASLLFAQSMLRQEQQESSDGCSVVGVWSVDVAGGVSGVVVDPWSATGGADRVLGVREDGSVVRITIGMDGEASAEESGFMSRLRDAEEATLVGGQLCAWDTGDNRAERIEGVQVVCCDVPAPGEDWSEEGCLEHPIRYADGRSRDVEAVQVLANGSAILIGKRSTPPERWLLPSFSAGVAARLDPLVSIANLGGSSANLYAAQPTAACDGDDVVLTYGALHTKQWGSLSLPLTDLIAYEGCTRLVGDRFLLVGDASHGDETPVVIVDCGPDQLVTHSLEYHAPHAESRADRRQRRKDRRHLNN